jgi:hypothetical protein
MISTRRLTAREWKRFDREVVAQNMRVMEDRIARYGREFKTGRARVEYYAELFVANGLAKTIADAELPARACFEVFREECGAIPLRSAA